MASNQPWIALYQHEVRAILDRRQTQFRRVIKPQPEVRGAPCGQPTVYAPDGYVGQTSGDGKQVLAVYGEGSGKGIRCPHGTPGDVLAAKETWKHAEVDWLAGGEVATQWWTQYRADDALIPIEPVCCKRKPVSGTDYIDHHWSRSIHMPRSRCRLFLKVKDIRVERVQEISSADMVAEGWPHASEPEPGASGPFESVTKGDMASTGLSFYKDDLIEWFADLWDSINGQRDGCSWANNPWVYAGTFERVDGP